MSPSADPPLTDDLPPALATPPGAGAVCDAQGARKLGRGAAEGLMLGPAPVLVAHAAMSARHLGLEPPPRSAHLLDVLELFAFVRPARFCAPTPSGLAVALGLEEPRDAVAQARALRAVAARLLDELADPARTDSLAALTLNATFARAGWSWAGRVEAALERGLSASGRMRRDRREPGTGLDAWNRLPEWEDSAPRGEADSHAIDSESARIRLEHMLRDLGLDEARPSQSDYAAEAAYVFSPRDRHDEPRALLAEAGTGTGKTLGYLAPAGLWAERNQGTVWVSTYTRALQRQIARESRVLADGPNDGPSPHRRVVVRKGRENYLCLLNLQDAVQQAQLGVGDLIALGLTARWAEACADGDMTGGDFPAWLPGLYAAPFAHQAWPVHLVDRRGECIHAACPHYRRCFVEKTVRAARQADVVIANHALVMVQAAAQASRPARDQAQEVEGGLKRLVFDEGHHLFEAADSAFSACLSGQEAAELRRWIRGPEARGRRGRGLEERLSDLIGEEGAARRALSDVMAAATRLPGDGVQTRLLRGSDAGGPTGPIETFLAAALDQLRARADGPGQALNEDQGLECAARPATPALQDAARAAARALAEIEAPLLALSRHLEDVLDEEAETLDGASRARIEGALRGLDRRARQTLPAWRAMLGDLAADTPEGTEDFVDWLATESAFGRLADVALKRHWIDPTRPLEQAVIRPAHGVLITSATLTDPGFGDDPFHLARLRSATARLDAPARTLKLDSPFDYAAQARVIVVTDVARDDPRRTASAMRALFLASGGGALGLFTAIRRLRAVYGLLGPELGRAGLPLYAQHIDPLDTGALVDVFRTERDSCLLGTDAIRDGVDVPGRALRLLVFDRVPWPRPDLLHRTRRERFVAPGGQGSNRAYDDALARGRLAQAFGRLIRRADDQGVFVMLDAACPTRLFASLPPGVEVSRMDLAGAVETVSRFLAGTDHTEPTP